MVPRLQIAPVVAEVLVEFTDLVLSEGGISYTARACGGESADGLWQGWIEFIPADGTGEPVRSPRETTQPNRTDTLYWATGLTAVYLEGALHRALHPIKRRESVEPGPPLFDAPAPQTRVPPQEAILNPFSVYQKGEQLLRRQLTAFSSWHLVNIIRAHQLDTRGRDPERMLPSDLIELIVSEVRRAFAPRGSNPPGQSAPA
jgi:hypothetical protein